MIERVEVVAGPGTVIRYGAVVAWAAPSASPALISFLAQSARNLAGSARGGRQMADHIAGVLHERDPEPHVAFAVVGPDPLGWASLLHGPVQAWDGLRWLAPTPSPGWLQAIITPQPSVMVNAAGNAVPTVSPDSMWDLEAGVVPGSGFVLFPTVARSSEGFGIVAPVIDHAEPEAEVESELTVVGPVFEGVGGEGEETATMEVSPPTEVLEAVQPGLPGLVEPIESHDPLPTAAAEPEPGPELEPKQELEPELEPAAASPPPGPPGSIDLRRPPEGDARQPLPASAGPDRTVPGAAVVGGVVCEREHLNRPGMRDCVRCGAPLRTDTPYTVSGSRPPLGCLVGDDGTVWRLDSAYLVGSNPATDPTVRGGVARPLALSGEELSAAHAEVRLADWDVQVVDRSSAAGTFVFEPGADNWLRLQPYELRTLKPGTHVAFGQRIVTYLTPWTSRDPSAGEWPSPSQT